jgi:hypothetical protein
VVWGLCRELGSAGIYGLKNGDYAELFASGTDFRLRNAKDLSKLLITKSVALCIGEELGAYLERTHEYKFTEEISESVPRLLISET